MEMYAGILVIFHFKCLHQQTGFDKTHTDSQGKNLKLSLDFVEFLYNNNNNNNNSNKL